LLGWWSLSARNLWLVQALRARVALDSIGGGLDAIGADWTRSERTGYQAIQWTELPRSLERHERASTRWTLRPQRCAACRDQWSSGGALRVGWSPCVPRETNTASKSCGGLRASAWTPGTVLQRAGSDPTSVASFEEDVIEHVNRDASI
jgi:hypothetical protein